MFSHLSSRKNQKKIKKDIKVLSLFVEIYCQNHHKDKEKNIVRTNGLLKNFSTELSRKLCKECERLLLYSVTKRVLCPYEPKPACKKCPAPCYKDGFREKMREVMRFSGAYLIKRGRLDYIFKYFF